LQSLQDAGRVTLQDEEIAENLMSQSAR